MPDLLHLFGCPPRPAFAATSGDEDVLDRLAEWAIQATRPSLPARLSLYVRFFHIRQPTLPIDMVDEPRLTTKQQDPRTIVLTQERQLIDEPQLLPAMEYRKERRREKDGKQFEEVL